ncbi:hypothetical protein A3A48_02590 [Candidatus Curtissbacteria bacterium RIFCSPLOWO2_01_FULL_37_9]|uniref:AI-2E family transporter n=1 Tax=Candidatus Curtissbacteria bacterium RIFCSPLOWO2_01_FULL_37_9 TaxID=1797724 RepID=A0A1F5GQS0_9BACT|nr:MAG: hypothetical protein A3A48_02590 [Candidatus Curtissbacteria bacterium RIFCSPLOWO2_01_FULL_37_9]
MAEAKSPIRIEISYKTVVFTVAFLIGLWFLVQIREIIIIIFLSIIFLAALLKPVNWLSTRKIPRVISVIIVYLLVVVIISAIIGLLIPPLIFQTSGFITKLPQIIATINDFLIFHKIPVEDISKVITPQLQNIAGNFVSISTTIFSSLFLILTIMVFTFYLLLEWKKVVKLISSPFTGSQEKKVSVIISKVENGLGLWVRGQLTLSIIVGVLTYCGLRILGIPYALPLSLIAGVLEIIPIIGPIISAIPAILVGLTIAPVMGLAVGALFFIIQQLENNFIVPMVMSRVIGLQPPVVIITLLIGAKLAGVGGAFLSIPIVVVAKIIIQEILREEQNFEDGLQEM